MLVLATHLDLDRCPHCSGDSPNIGQLSTPLQTANYRGGESRIWKAYRCAQCGGVVTAAAYQDGGPVIEMYPEARTVDDSIPKRPRRFLEQGLNSLHAPSGAIMLAASAVDAMLKENGYKDGSLYNRIDKAAADHLITKDMARWAHQVRLDANEQRHADENVEEPSSEEAKQSLEFALALAEFMFVLPSRVTKGLKESEPKT